MSLNLARILEHAERMDDAPPISDEQVERLAALLAGTKPVGEPLRLTRPGVRTSV